MPEPRLLDTSGEELPASPQVPHVSLSRAWRSSARRRYRYGGGGGGVGVDPTNPRWLVPTLFLSLLGALGWVGHDAEASIFALRNDHQAGLTRLTAIEVDLRRRDDEAERAAERRAEEEKERQGETEKLREEQRRLKRALVLLFERDRKYNEYVVEALDGIAAEVAPKLRRTLSDKPQLDSHSVELEVLLSTP